MTSTSKLGELLGTSQPVILLPGAVDRFMELAVRSLVRQRMLMVVAGGLAEHYASIAEACGRDVALACVPPGQPMRPEWLDRFLRSPGFEAVAVVQQEDEPGEPMPLAELAPVVRRNGALFIADVTASAGRSPVQADQWGLDLVFAGGEGGSPIPSWLVDRSRFRQGIAAGGVDAGTGPCSGPGRPPRSSCGGSYSRSAARILRCSSGQNRQPPSTLNRLTSPNSACAACASCCAELAISVVEALSS